MWSMFCAGSSETSSGGLRLLIESGRGLMMRVVGLASGGRVHPGLAAEHVQLET